MKKVTQAELDERRRKAAVPSTVSSFQAKQALKDAGLFDQVDTAVQNSGDQMLKDAWAYSIEFDRDSPSIAAIADGLGLSESDLDDLFIAAKAIRA